MLYIPRRAGARKRKLFSLNSNVAEPAEVMIEAGDRQTFSNGGGSNQAVHKMNFRSFEAVESV